MVKNKEDKTKLSNWKENDVFALQIQSTEYPKYNGRYIIFIHTIINKEGWEMSRCTNSFRAKITKNKILPKNKEEIEKLEYIKTGWYGFLKESTLFPNDTKNLKMDEYQVIYTYLFLIHSSKFKIPKEIIYLGNYTIKLPENEYIPNSQHHGITYSFWNGEYSKIVDNLLEHYENIHLKKLDLFTKKFQKNFYQEELKEIEFQKNLIKFKKALSAPNGKKILKSLGIDIDKEIKKNNSLTYVGKEEKDSSKSKKNKD